MTYTATPYHKNPYSGGHEIYNFCWPFLGHHYHILSLSILWLGVCLFVCLELIVPLENFHSNGDVTITGEWLQILTCARHSWSLSVPHLLWHGTSVYNHNGNLKHPWHSKLLPSVKQWSCLYLFLRLRSVAAGIRTPNLRLTGRTLYPTGPPQRCGFCKVVLYTNIIKKVLK